MEAGFARGGVLQSPLLAVHAEEEEDAAADAVAQPVSQTGRRLGRKPSSIQRSGRQLHEGER